MKKLFLTALAVCLLLLSGCSGSSEQPEAPSAVCFVIANTANSQGLNLENPRLREIVQDTIEHYGFISVVNLDGSPELVISQSFDIPESHKKAAKQKLQADADANAAALLAALGSVAANDPETDYLEALRLASRSLSSLDGYSRKTIYLLGTGLSTAGTLDFRNNLLSAEPDTVVQLLRERREIPDLTGMSVIWQQLGDTAAPQNALTQAQRSRLADLWRSVVESGGGSFLCDTTPPLSVNTQISCPDVSVVELPEALPIAFQPENTGNLLDAPLMLTDSQITFHGDTADFLEPQKAAEQLIPIVDFLNAHPDMQILLVGTTAGDTNTDYTQKLSCARAETVRNTLIALGISANRITAIGMGTEDPWHIRGVGIEGDLAAANRKVVLLDAASRTARDLLDR